MLIEYVAKCDIRNTRGQIEVRPGETVNVRPSANPGMVHITTTGTMQYTALVPARWLELK